MESVLCIKADIVSRWVLLQCPAISADVSSIKYVNGDNGATQQDTALTQQYKIQLLQHETPDFILLAMLSPQQPRPEPH